MKSFKKLQATLAMISCIGFILPTTVVGAVASPASFAQDVAMGQGGVLQGKVMNASGSVVPGAKVQIHQAGDVVDTVATDAEGTFRFNELRGGVYQVATAGAATQFRLWASQTAPPNASQAALLVTSSEVVRGQCCDTMSDCGCYDPCASSCTAPSMGCGCGGGGCGCGGGGCGGGSLLPWLLIGGAVAAVAIPLALDDDDAS